MTPARRAWSLSLALVFCSACIPRPVVPPGMVEVGARPLPGRLSDDRFFAAPITENGDTLVLSVETGTGASMLYAATVERLGLPVTPLVSGADTAWLVELPALHPAADIPPLAEMPDVGSRFFVFPAEAEGEDGFLGQSWLAGRTWVFDYPAGRLWLLPPGVLPSHAAAQRVPLGFRTDAAGMRVVNVPRIRVKVGDDSLDLVLDTGAAAAYTDSALTRLGVTGSAVRGASLISLSALEGLRQRYPDWPVMTSADANTGMPMIRVPSVEVAGLSTGPVWFVAVPDEVFAARSARLTDRPVVGALGGNALRRFTVTLDYENGVAVFGEGSRQSSVISHQY